MKSCRFLLAVVYLALCTAAFGQATTASLTGVVDDPSKAVIPKVSVTAINNDTGAKTQTFTNKEGQYVFPSLQTGHYRIEVDKQGFKGIIEAGLTLHVQDIVQVNFHMAVGSMSETVTVNSDSVQLNTTNGAVSTVIDRALIENMPLNSKDLTTLFELSPGTVMNTGGSPNAGGGFSVNGQRPTSNYLTIDGASGNVYTTIGTGGGNVAGSTIATSASGGTSGILPIDAIEEYRMDTSTYTAENGRTPGGQIQVRTRSGTNQFHGTLFENFRNQVLDATDWFVNYNHLKQSQLRMNEFGGTVGGPILKNRIFFFVAHDTLLLDQPTTTTQAIVPSQTLRATAYPAFKAFMAAYPIGNGGADPSLPGFEYYNSSNPFLIRNHTTSVRLDGQLPRSMHGFFRANIAPSSSLTTGYQSIQAQDNIHSYTGGLTTPFGKHLINEFTVNETSNETSRLQFVGPAEGNDPNAILNNLPSGVGKNDLFEFNLNANFTFSYVVNGPSSQNSLSQWNILDSLAWQVGKHTFKFGVDFLTKQSKVYFPGNQYFVYTAGDAEPFPSVQAGAVSEFDTIRKNGQPNYSIRNTSLYVNDDWHVSSNFIVNYGLRWEFNPGPSVGPLGVLAIQGTSLNPATFSLAVSTQPLYVNVYDNFAPRLGFAWTIPGDPRFTTVLRGGAGIYFDTGQSANAVQAGAGSYPYTSTNYNSSAGQTYSTLNFSSSTTPSKEFPIASGYFVDPSLQSPRTYEWSLTVEQMFGKSTKLSTSYIGNDGERLVEQNVYTNTPNAQGVYPFSTSLISAFSSVHIATNESHSNYQALQMQLTSRIGSRLDALASYTWGHAEDNGSTDFSGVGGLAKNPLSDSSNDLRHIFAMAIHYAPDGLSEQRIVRAITQGWAFDTITRLQTAAPLTVTAANNNPNAFVSNADVVAGQPAVLHERLDSSGKIVPGGVLLNWAAFTAPPKDAGGNPTRQGNSPTNGYRLFGLKQWDIAMNRTWKIWEQTTLNFRVDAFNLLNTPSFAQPFATWSPTNASTFGRASNTYASANGSTPANGGQTGSQLAVFQNGAPRSLQLSLKLKF